MDNETLYREFWIKATRDKLIEMSEDLREDARVEDFDKLESDISKSDAKAVIAWIDWVTPLIRPMFSPSNTAELNRLRLMKLLREKLARRLNKS